MPPRRKKAAFAFFGKATSRVGAADSGSESQLLQQQPHRTWHPSSAASTSADTSAKPGPGTKGGPSIRVKLLTRAFLIAVPLTAIAVLLRSDLIVTNPEISGTPVTLPVQNGTLGPFTPAPRGKPRRLSDNPEPYYHPKLLFSEKDRGLLVKSATSWLSPSRGAFLALSSAVDKVVNHPESPMREIFGLLLTGMDEIHTLGNADVAGAKLKELVADPEKKVKGDNAGGEAPAVLQGAFYDRLFKWGLAPTSREASLHPSIVRLVPPGQSDTSVNLGIMYLFASGTIRGVVHRGQPGTVYMTSPIYRVLQAAAYVAWIKGDVEEQKKLASVLCVAAQIHLQFYPPAKANWTSGAGTHAQYDKDYDDSASADLALAYDLLHNAALEEQRIPVRRLLQRMGVNRIVRGFDLAAYERCTGPGLAPFLPPIALQDMDLELLLVQYVVEWERVESAAGGLEELEHDGVASDLNAKTLAYYFAHGSASDPSGIHKLGPGYIPSIPFQAAVPLLAAARRGYPIFDLPSFYASLMDGLATLGPHSDPVTCSASAPGTPPSKGAPPSKGTHFTPYGGPLGGGLYALLKYIFPMDPLVQFAYQWYADSCLKALWEGPQDQLVMHADVAVLSLVLGADVVTTEPPRYSELERLNPFPPALLAPWRGLGVARASWTNQNAASLVLDTGSFGPYSEQGGVARPSTNDFEFRALGRKWVALGAEGHAEHRIHSTVLVDGVGQAGGGPIPPGLELSHGPAAFPGAVVEAVSYSVSAQGSAVKAPELAVLFTMFSVDNVAAYSFVADGAPAVAAECKGSPNPMETPVSWSSFFRGGSQGRGQGGGEMDGGKGGPSEGSSEWGPLLFFDKEAYKPSWRSVQEWASWKMCATARYNPVLHAFRAVAFVSSPLRSWVLIVDDLRKDQVTRVYTWVANFGPAFEPSPDGSFMRPAVRMLDVAQYGLSNVTDAVFVKGEDFDDAAGMPKPGTPRLLLRVVYSQGTSRPISLVHFAPEAENNKGAKEGGWLRVEISRRNKEPYFKVALIPFMDGEELPVTGWDPAQNELQVLFKDQAQALKVERHYGRSSIKLLLVS